MENKKNLQHDLYYARKLAIDTVKAVEDGKIDLKKAYIISRFCSLIFKGVLTEIIVNTNKIIEIESH